MDKEPIGEIYLIRNKENEKCYIGQAMKMVGVVKPQKWGAQGRWRSHLREAKNTVEKGLKDHCTILNQAIRKYGEDKFDVITLCECTSVEEMDKKEAEYIQEYNSMVPNGYNLNYGGAKGKDSDETREKKKQMRLGKKHDEETKNNISKGQIGNRREVKARKYPEDADLPKYISASRKNKVIIGYMICCFPIGVEKKEYVSKMFISKSNPEQDLQNAKIYLSYLEETYKHIPSFIATKPTNITVKTNELPLDQIFKKKLILKKPQSEKSGS
jgi:group I intron endonuclease